MVVRPPTLYSILSVHSINFWFSMIQIQFDLFFSHRTLLRTHMIVDKIDI